MKTLLIACGLAAIVFFKVGALTLGSVGTYQLNASYFCNVTATEVQHRAQCRNELDGFGSLLVLAPEGVDYITHKRSMHQ